MISVPKQRVGFYVEPKKATMTRSAGESPAARTTLAEIEGEKE